MEKAVYILKDIEVCRHFYWSLSPYERITHGCWAAMFQIMCTVENTHLMLVCAECFVSSPATSGMVH